MFPNPKKALVALWVSMLISYFGFCQLMIQHSFGNTSFVASERNVPTDACASMMQAFLENFAGATACYTTPLTITVYIPAFRNAACAKKMPASNIGASAGTTYEVLVHQCYYRKNNHPVKRNEDDDDQSNLKA